MDFIDIQTPPYNLICIYWWAWLAKNNIVYKVIHRDASEEEKRAETKERGGRCPD